jgi:hypothetical protein
VNRVELDPTAQHWRENRFVTVLRVAARQKTRARELVRPSLAAEFFRENPMPWLLDSEPIEAPPTGP